MSERTLRFPTPWNGMKAHCAGTLGELPRCWDWVRLW